MKTKHYLLILTTILFVTFTGCKKYDDGPTFSPWPKKWRVVNTWKEVEIIVNGVGTSINNDNTIEFKGNGDCISNIGSSLSVNGTWEFGDKKETIKTTYSGSTSESTILRLTSNEMWLTDDNGVTEIHYESAK